MIKHKFAKFLQPIHQPTVASIGFLILRVIFGLAFVQYGWGKITNPFTWMDAQGPSGVPGFFQLLAAVSEFGGGLALIVGALTPIAMAGLAFTMLVATYMVAVAMKLPFIDQKTGFGFDRPLIYLGIALLFMLAGPGKFSLDALLFGQRPAKL